MDTPTTIDEVLVALDGIIEDCLSNTGKLAIFAYVYRRTTAKIKEGISAGVFEDNERMEKFDVRFARFYIDAYHNWKNGKPVSRSWLISFDARDEPLALMQHLLMGMNAHINMDLALTAAEMSTSETIDSLKSDFFKVNELLFELTDEFQERLGRVSPLLFLLDWVSKRSDERIANFSIAKAREKSWSNAKILVSLPEDLRQDTIEGIDKAVMTLSEALIRPKSRWLRWGWDLIRRFETNDTRKVLDQISE